MFDSILAALGMLQPIDCFVSPTDARMALTPQGLIIHSY